MKARFSYRASFPSTTTSAPIDIQLFKSFPIFARSVLFVASSPRLSRPHGRPNCWLGSFLASGRQRWQLGPSGGLRRSRLRQAEPSVADGVSQGRKCGAVPPVLGPPPARRHLLVAA